MSQQSNRRSSILKPSSNEDTEYIARIKRRVSWHTHRTVKEYDKTDHNIDCTPLRERLQTPNSTMSTEKSMGDARRIQSMISETTDVTVTAEVAANLTSTTIANATMAFFDRISKDGDADENKEPLPSATSTPKVDISSYRDSPTLQMFDRFVPKDATESPRTPVAKRSRTETTSSDQTLAFIQALAPAPSQDDNLATSSVEQEPAESEVNVSMKSPVAKLSEDALFAHVMSPTTDRSPLQVDPEALQVFRDCTLSPIKAISRTDCSPIQVLPDSTLTDSPSRVFVPRLVDRSVLQVYEDTLTPMKSSATPKSRLNELRQSFHVQSPTTDRSPAVVDEEVLKVFEDCTLSPIKPIATPKSQLSRVKESAFMHSPTTDRSPLQMDPEAAEVFSKCQLSPIKPLFHDHDELEMEDVGGSQESDSSTNVKNKTYVLEHSHHKGTYITDSENTTPGSTYTIGVPSNQDMDVSNATIASMDELTSSHDMSALDVQKKVLKDSLRRLSGRMNARKSIGSASPLAPSKGTGAETVLDKDELIDSVQAPGDVTEFTEIDSKLFDAKFDIESPIEDVQTPRQCAAPLLDNSTPVKSVAPIASPSLRRSPRLALRSGNIFPEDQSSRMFADGGTLESNEALPCSSNASSKELSEYERFPHLKEYEEAVKKARSLDLKSFKVPVVTEACLPPKLRAAMAGLDSEQPMNSSVVVPPTPMRLPGWQLFTMSSLGVCQRYFPPDVCVKLKELNELLAKVLAVSGEYESEIPELRKLLANVNGELLIYDQQYVTSYLVCCIDIAYIDRYFAVLRGETDFGTSLRELWIKYLLPMEKLVWEIREAIKSSYPYDKFKVELVRHWLSREKEGDLDVDQLHNAQLAWQRKYEAVCKLRNQRLKEYKQAKEQYKRQNEEEYECLLAGVTESLDHWSSAITTYTDATE